MFETSEQHRIYRPYSSHTNERYDFRPCGLGISMIGNFIAGCDKPIDTKRLKESKGLNYSSKIDLGV
jgi:hypothetical protein